MARKLGVPISLGIITVLAIIFLMGGGTDDKDILRQTFHIDAVYYDSGHVEISYFDKSGKTNSVVMEILGMEESFQKTFSDSKFIADDGGGASSENHIFIMNAVDYLLGDRELISLRSREITNRPLEELTDEEKSRWKWINLLLPSILVVGFGFIRLKRENSRAKVLEEIYD